MGTRTAWQLRFSERAKCGASSKVLLRLEAQGAWIFILHVLPIVQQRSHEVILLHRVFANSSQQQLQESNTSRNSHHRTTKHSKTETTTRGQKSFSKGRHDNLFFVFHRLEAQSSSKTSWLEPQESRSQILPSERWR